MKTTVATHFSTHQKRLERLLRHRLLGPTLGVSESVGLGEVWESAFLTRTQVLRMLLV